MPVVKVVPMNPKIGPGKSAAKPRPQATSRQRQQQQPASQVLTPHVNALFSSIGVNLPNNNNMTPSSSSAPDQFIRVRGGMKNVGKDNTGQSSHRPFKCYECNETFS